jgi:hypothetical protein
VRITTKFVRYKSLHLYRTNIKLVPLCLLILLALSVIMSINWGLSQGGIPYLW